MGRINYCGFPLQNDARDKRPERFVDDLPIRFPPAVQSRIHSCAPTVNITGLLQFPLKPHCLLLKQKLNPTQNVSNNVSYRQYTLFSSNKDIEYVSPISNW